MPSTASMLAHLKQAIALVIDNYQLSFTRSGGHVSALRAQDIVSLETILAAHQDGCTIITEIEQWILDIQTGLLGRSQLRDNVKAVIERDEFSKTLFYRERIAELELLATQIPPAAPEIVLIQDDPVLLKQQLTSARQKIEELTTLSEKQRKNIAALTVQNERLIEINHKLAQECQKLKVLGHDSVLSSSPSDVLQRSFRSLSLEPTD